jgi:serine phosphatase RsbU (regulator of sigma subunit)
LEIENNAELEKGFNQEVKDITVKAAETSWPLTAFCCFFFIFVEIHNRDNKDYFMRFCLLDFGAGLVVLFMHLLRRQIRYPLPVITYGSSVLVAVVATIAAVNTTPENVFTYFWIVSMITVVRGLLYCQKVSTVAFMSLCNHLLIIGSTLLFRDDPYFEMPNILSTNIIQMFMVIFALSGANIRYKLTKSNYINSYRIRAAAVMLEGKNRDITDSINYAKRIQTSLLASKKMLHDNIPEHFIFFQPKDIVSGDFYWGSLLPNNTFAIAVADSTGHGVPGAIMSMLNISCLNEAVSARGLSEPGPILNYSRSRIMEHMANDGSDEGGKDGMDAVLACFNLKDNLLEFAAANNPLWLIRNGQLEEHHPDKMPVGKPMGVIRPFTGRSIQLQKDDLVIMFTDGFVDQFGGPKGKKLMHKGLKEFIGEVQHLPVQEIGHRLHAAFDKWKGTYEQVDDVLVFGVRV